MTEPDIPLSAATGHEDAQDSAGSAEQYASAAGARLVKLEGRVFVRFSGEVEADLLRIPYDLVPAQGVLAKPPSGARWTTRRALALVRERSRPRRRKRCAGRWPPSCARSGNRPTTPGWMRWISCTRWPDRKRPSRPNSCSTASTSGWCHAIERAQEERHAARTRESINLAEYPDSFEVARRLPRRFIALLGPTNSGKTHKAMEALMKAKSGVYLAPLRLLALENYRAHAGGAPAWQGTEGQPVTGEERRLAEGATHVASTVEMLDTPHPVDVAVIDEIQMLADRDRGAAWTAAVCGAPATHGLPGRRAGSARAIEALAERLECPLEVHVLKRKAPLSMEAGPVRKLRNLRRGDAVIAFSRRDVLMWRDMIAETGTRCHRLRQPVARGAARAGAALPRRRGRHRGRHRRAGDGLNMPISRIVMTTAVKFNGVEEEEIPAALARQIAGRAGRYGVHEEGWVAGYDEDTHEVMRALLKEKLAPVPASGFSVAPTLEHLHRIAAVTRETSLAAVQALRAQHRCAGRLLLSAHYRGTIGAGALAGHAAADHFREVHAVAGAHRQPCADAAAGLGRLGPGIGEEAGDEARSRPARTWPDDAAGGGRPVPAVFGLCLAGISDARILPQHRGSAVAGAHCFRAGGRDAAGAECGAAAAPGQAAQRLKHAGANPACLDVPCRPDWVRHCAVMCCASSSCRVDQVQCLAGIEPCGFLVVSRWEDAGTLV
jgi:ATP-dependent RNA helicase SUPV3L1/SUV3